MRFFLAVTVSLLSILQVERNVFADVVFAINVTNANPGTSDRIVRATFDGGTQQTLWSGAFGSFSPRGLAIDATNGRAVWSDITDRGIKAVPLIGGTTSTLFTVAGTASPNSVAVDNAGGDLFVMEITGSTNRQITEYDNFVGTSPSAFVVDTSNFSGNSWLTVGGDFLYYSDNINIRRVPVSGGASEIVVANTGNGVRGLATSGDSIYWLDNTSDLLSRRSISNALDPIQTLALATGATPQGLATNGTYLYFADQATANNGIYRVNMDLTGSTRIVTLVSGEIPNGVAAIPEPSSIVLLTVGLLLSVSRRGRLQHIA